MTAVNKKDTKKAAKSLIYKIIYFHIIFFLDKTQKNHYKFLIV